MPTISEQQALLRALEYVQEKYNEIASDEEILHQVRNDGAEKPQGELVIARNYLNPIEKDS